MKTFLKIFLPLILVVGGGALMALMILNRPRIESQTRVDNALLVRVQTAIPTNVTFHVESQGTVRPKTQIQLVSEVSGVIQEVFPTMQEGAYFESGDVLVQIDPKDYEIAVVQAKARLLEAEAQLIREETEAEVARKEWNDLGREGDPSPLLLRKPQLAEARARVDSAKANLEQAERDLDKTRIRAPFYGRVLSQNADLGQFVSRGSLLGEIYSTDAAEIRLPLPTEELAYVDLPFHFQGESGSKEHPPVQLTARLGGRQHTWRGHVVRTEGEINPSTRMITAVAEVTKPYHREGADKPPLAAGLFVRAEIRGKSATNVFELDRSALRDGNTVLIVDPDNQLRFRTVKVLRADRDRVLIGTGLQDGERVCISPIEAPVEGMRVRVNESTEPKTDRSVAVSNDPETILGGGTQ